MPRLVAEDDPPKDDDLHNESVSMKSRWSSHSITIKSPSKRSPNPVTISGSKGHPFFSPSDGPTWSVDRRQGRWEVVPDEDAQEGRRANPRQKMAQRTAQRTALRATKNMTKRGRFHHEKWWFHGILMGLNKNKSGFDREICWFNGILLKLMVIFGYFHGIWSTKPWELMKLIGMGWKGIWKG